MHLINVSTFELEAFVDADQVPGGYAILSHRWEQEEVLFKDITDDARRLRMRNLKGWYKIQKCCEQAAHERLRYAWVDTCCIDKSSSAELQEAINSMFRWYEMSQACYVYLADVRRDTSLPSTPHDFVRSQWFSRGWTLQELLAPHQLVFYDAIWKFIGNRQNLGTEIQDATNIPKSIAIEGLTERKRPCIADIMSWAGRRKTTRVEDLAYSLLGLFKVNMTMLYGEGENAFLRLQEQILSRSDDQSIFAWHCDGLDDLADSKAYSPGTFGRASVGTNPHQEPDLLEASKSMYPGLLARSPQAFVRRQQQSAPQSVPPAYMERRKSSMVTSDGIAAEFELVPRAPGVYVALLNAEISQDNSKAQKLGILVKRLDDEGRFARLRAPLARVLYNTTGLTTLSTGSSSQKRLITVVRELRDKEHDILTYVDPCVFWVYTGGLGSLSVYKVSPKAEVYRLETLESNFASVASISGQPPWGLAGMLDLRAYSKVMQELPGKPVFQPYGLAFGYDIDYKPICVIMLKAMDRPAALLVKLMEEAITIESGFTDGINGQFSSTAYGDGGTTQNINETLCIECPGGKWLLYADEILIMKTLTRTQHSHHGFLASIRSRGHPRKSLLHVFMYSKSQAMYSKSEGWTLEVVGD